MGLTAKMASHIPLTHRAEVLGHLLNTLLHGHLFVLDLLLFLLYLPEVYRVPARTCTCLHSTQ